MAQRFNTSSGAADLGFRIREARVSAGITLVQLGAKSGVDPGQISKIERGKMVTLSRNVQKICTLLGVGVDPLPIREFASSPVAQRIDALIATSCFSERTLSKLVAALEDVAAEAAGKPAAQV